MCKCEKNLIIFFAVVIYGYMGNSQSEDHAYKNGLDEVGGKARWRRGLIVNVLGRDPLYVSDIRPIITGPPAGTLRISEGADTVYVYYYVGSNVIIDAVDAAPGYEIYLKKLSQGKIGGGRREIDEDLIEFNDKKPDSRLDFSADSKAHCTNDNTENSEFDSPPCDKDIFRSANGRAPSLPSINFPDDHPDDNIESDPDN